MTVYRATATFIPNPTPPPHSITAHLGFDSVRRTIDCKHHARLLFMEPDRPTFRNGLPMRLLGWLQVKIGKLYGKRVSRFVKLNGEVLSLHTSEHSLPIDEFDIYGSLVQFNVANPSKKDFRVIVGKKSLSITCGSYEEMLTWAQSMQVASSRSFQDCYNLGARIGEGTYSKVYRCYDAVDPSMEFVVKVVSKKMIDFESRKWLERERHVNTVVSHRCVVQAVDMFCNLDTVQIVFEHMRGGTVRDLLKRHRALGESYTRVIMRELLLALQYLHSKNIVHRDVRPDNLFCSHTKFPMAIALGDFGYSNFFSDKVVNCDVLTTIIGTPPYTASEICRREKYGPAVDLWSAGVVMFELLCGRAPFEGRTDRETNENIVRGLVSFKHVAWKNISQNCKKLVLQLLQPDPHKRISALAALQHAWFGPTGASLVGGGSSQRLITPSESTRTLLERRDQLEQLDQEDERMDSASSGTDEDDAQRERAFPRNTTGRASRREMHSFSRVHSSASSTISQDTAAQQFQLPRHGSGGSLMKRASAPVSGLNGQKMFRSASLSVGNQAHSNSTLQYTPSLSSLSSTGQQSRMAMTPSMLRIQQVGLERAAKENPERMKVFLKSPMVKSQLSSIFSMRRKLIVASRAFVAVFRMRALVHGQSLTRNLSKVGSAKALGLIAASDRKALNPTDAASTVARAKAPTGGADSSKAQPPPSPRAFNLPMSHKQKGPSKSKT